MNNQQSRQNYWAWIMGAITLLIALFFPSFLLPGTTTYVGGFCWQLLSSSHVSNLQQVVLLTTDPPGLVSWLLPPSILTACTIWFWSRQMSSHSTISRGMLVTLEATGLALLVTSLFSLVVFTILSANVFGIVRAFIIIIRTGASFLTFFPCLLIVAALLAGFQRKNRVA